jgi:hypothetical protein
MAFSFHHVAPHGKCKSRCNHLGMGRGHTIRLCETLTGHSKESECLRVAWYVLVNSLDSWSVMTILSRAFFALTLVFSFSPP